MSYCPFLSKNVSINYVPTVDATSTVSTTADDGLGNITTTETTTRTPFDTVDIISKFSNVIIQTGITGGLKSIDKFGEAIVGTQVIFTECVQSQCQLWDSASSNCSITSLSSKLTSLSSSFNNVVGEAADSADYIPIHSHQSLTNVKSNLVNLLKHNNVKHGDPSIKNITKNPASNVLSMEYFSSEDLDDNGKIFGVDFILTDDDSKPLSIKNLDYVVASLGLPEISYSDYKSWMEDGGTDPLA